MYACFHFINISHLQQTDSLGHTKVLKEIEEKKRERKKACNEEIKMKWQWYPKQCFVCYYKHRA